MMATAALLKAYLDWQSDMGTEDVILPHPLVRKAARAAGPQAANPRGAPGDGKPAQKAAMPSPGEAAAPGLFESLAKALERAANPKAADSVPSDAFGGSAGRGTEAHNMPFFPGLGDFWEYLEKRPRLLLGEAPAAGAETTALPVSQVIRSAGPAKAPLALIGFEPGDAEAAEGKAFGGEAGALLEKMMRAIRLDLGGLYLGNLVKVRVAGKAWSRRELARIVPLLHIELGLAQVPKVLLLGQECAQAVLKTGKTLDELRQETHRMEGREFFVTHHPRDLIRKEELKRKAWEDLQWLQRRMAEGTLT
ncbi:MAG TPA: uracil-DNA glycosylase family protein [Fibrobacteria bacterium]|nr:uracil-DNA glycosylase family protein [Fibrobacteria bacterium]